ALSRGNAELRGVVLHIPDSCIHRLPDALKIRLAIRSPWRAIRPGLGRGRRRPREYRGGNEMLHLRAHLPGGGILCACEQSAAVWKLDVGGTDAKRLVERGIPGDCHGVSRWEVCLTPA